MDEKLDAMSILQNNIDELFKQHGKSKCSMFDEYQCSFNILENVLKDATNHIEMVDRNLSNIEADIIEIKKLITKQDK